jgi:threonine/homoserine/homoserine lactone efflux protein
MWIYLLQGLALGFAAASQPGIFQSYLISKSLEHGWKHTFPSTFAPVLSDIPIVVLVLAILSQMPIWLELGLHISGGIFLIYLSMGVWKKYYSYSKQDLIPAGSSKTSLWQAALVNFLNPAPYLGWMLIMGPLFLQAWRESPVTGISFISGFYFTLIITSMGIVVLFSLARKLGSKINRILIGVSALTLALLGLYQFFLGISMAGRLKY